MNNKLFDLYATSKANTERLRKQIVELDLDWQHLAEYGMLLDAVSSYRKKYMCDMRTALEAVKSFNDSK